ncbi:hypothetical protein ACYOEI_35205 [Singulisphaera rosea]
MSVGQYVTEQDPPRPSDRPAVWPLVIRDMTERDEGGRKKYGTPLQPFNGRDPIVDAYQEGLDQVVYLRQAIEERAEIVRRLKCVQQFMVVSDLPYPHRLAEASSMINRILADWGAIPA